MFGSYFAKTFFKGWFICLAQPFLKVDKVKF